MDYSYRTLELYIVPLRSDNYSYVIHDRAAHQTLVIDPSSTQPLIDFLDQKGFGLDLIINTHHHDDHSEGNVGLQARFGAKLAASAYDAGKNRITGTVSTQLKDGDTLAFSDYTFRVLATPGHTLGHVCLVLDGAEWLFSGDTLFALGCGRLFEGNPEIMWASFLKLRGLKDQTLVFCGHEYTLSNARFALSIAPALPGLKDYIETVHKRFEKEGRTVPSELSDEKRFNPFMLADHSYFASLGTTATEVFGEIRKRKDSF